MAITRFVVLLAAMTLFITSCGGDGDDEQADDPPAEDGSTPDDGPEAELDDGVAAIVNGEEISAETVDEQVDAIAESPQFAEQVEGDQGEETLELLRAEILSASIQTRIAVDGAEGLDRPVTDDDIDEARAQLEEEIGDAASLEEAIEEQGLTESFIDDQLRGLAAQGNVEAALEEEEGGEAPSEAPPGGVPPGQAPLSPSQQAAQQFLAERLSAAEVVADDDYGTWDPSTGRVTPPGGAPTAPMPGGGGAPPAPGGGAPSAPGGGAPPAPGGGAPPGGGS